MKDDQTKIKDELQAAMAHELVLLRDLLTSLHNEQNALLADDHTQLHTIMEERFELIKAFERWNDLISKGIDLLREEKGEKKEEDNFLYQLASLKHILRDDDVDLLFLQHQLLDLMTEIERISSAILFCLEHKPSSHFAQHITNGLSLRNTLKMAVAAPKKKSTVGLLDPE